VLSVTTIPIIVLSAIQIIISNQPGNVVNAQLKIAVIVTSHTTYVTNVKRASHFMKIHNMVNSVLKAMSIKHLVLRKSNFRIRKKG